MKMLSKNNLFAYATSELSQDAFIAWLMSFAMKEFEGKDVLLTNCARDVIKIFYPDMKDDTVVAILGGHSEDVVKLLPFKAYPLGYVNDTRRIVDVYRAVDLFVLPSLSENLPNTIMEAMACGVPSVGFKVGGIPEMIDHRRNGYVANYCDADDLACGIHWALFEADRQALAEACVRKVMSSYSQNAVAMKYIEVYNQALALKHYKI